MQLIRPSEITGKIISLIEDAKKELIVITAYNGFIDRDKKPWNKMINAFKKAKSKNIDISYYSRAGENHRGIDLIGIKPVLIKNLHAKIYLNDSYAIVSSMNLVFASDENSIDFAMITENKDEYSAVKKYVNEYILPFTPLSNPKTNNDVLNEIPVVEFFNNVNIDTTKTYTISKCYYQNSHFIKEFGFMSNNQKCGVWIYFSENGLLTKTESYFENYSENLIEYKGRISKYDIMLCLANVIGGLYNCSIKNFYFQSDVNFYTNSNVKILYDYIETHLNIKLDKRDFPTFEWIIDDIHYKIKKKSVLNITD